MSSDERHGDEDVCDTKRQHNLVGDFSKQVTVILSYHIVIAIGVLAGYWASGMVGAIIGAIVAIPLVLLVGGLVLFWALSYYDNEGANDVQ